MTDKTVTSWHIRSATPEDAAHLIGLARATFGARAWSDQSLTDCINAKDHSVVLGEDSKETPCGFAIWRIMEDEAELLTIGVLPRAQQKGLGGALLSALYASLVTIKINKLFLEVSVENAPAIALYRRAGFEKVSLRRGYYSDGTDALIMVRNL